VTQSSRTIARAPRASAVILLAGAALGLGACAALPPEEDPVQLRLVDVETRLLRIERLLDSGNLVKLADDLDRLRRENQELRGQVEELTHSLEQMQERQRQQFIDLDDRLGYIEERAVALGSGLPSDSSDGSAGRAVSAGELPVPGGDDRVNYQSAFELLREGRYADASNAFTQFLESFPDSPLADNAQYWLGETAYVQREFEDALAQFERVIEDYPDSRKVADALLKIGYCNHELGRLDAARDALDRVRTEFADTSAARLAEQRLARIARTGS